jgi:sulfate/thiosulfate transport system ATP-binding protein
MSIEVRNIHKTFGHFHALEDVSLTISSGELVALLGPSGSGKTTLLRVIAGLEIPDSGRVLLDGEEATARSVRERGVGFVFQHYALFRHMSIFENVAFGLRVRARHQRPSEGEIRRRVAELLALVQLDWAAERYPTQLSGGQRQRIALARALATEPRVLLLDEPFGALDAKVREELRRWLRRLHEELHLTGVFVTHDQEEALEVATKVAVLNEGKIEQAGTPEELYHHPATSFVSGFLGNVNLFHGRVEDGEVYLHGMPFVLNAANGAVHNGSAEQAVIYIRPHALDIEVKPNGHRGLPAKVRRINTAGPRVKVELLSDWGDPIFVEMDHERLQLLRLAPDIRVYLHPRNEEVFVYNAP